MNTFQPKRPKRSLLQAVATVALCAGYVVVALPFVGSLTVTSTVAQSSAIRDIQVAGNRRVEPETVRSYLQFSVGDQYDPAKVDSSLRALFGTGLFSDVRIDRQGAGVVVTVVENPVISQLAFEGNREIESTTLKGEVQLKQGSVYTRARALSDVQRILDVYRRQGRFAASVEPKIIELEQNRVNLVFEINEGGATKVKAINFVGNSAFSSSNLRDIVSTTQSSWFDFLKGTNIYDPDRLNLDRELLRQYYLKNGYADAQVVAATAELDRDGSGFIITFTVEEGELYRFGSVAIKNSVAAVRADGLQSGLLTKSGDIYNASDLDKSVEKLTLDITEQGYPFARVRPQADRDAAAKVINITFIVEDGPRIYIERINVLGNVRTKDYVIRREFRLAEGDAYNPLMVDRAKKRLSNLGFFKGVEIKRRSGSAQDRVVLDVEVTEQPTGELSFGAGYSTNEGVIGDVSISERNLLGNGQFLRLKVGGSASRFQIDLSFTEPRFLDSNIAVGFDLFHKDVNQLSTSSFKSRKTGGSLRAAMPLSENLWLNTSYTLSYDNLYEIDPTTASLAVLRAEGASLTSALGLGFTYDTRNHPRNPNRGLFFQVAGDFAGVGGDVKYGRYVGEARGYYPITEKITLVGRGVAGFIDGWGGQDVRLLDLFYKGGETIRGFGNSGYGPRDTVTGNALGGKTFWSTTAEVRFPLPFIPDELGMSGAAFADAGSLFGTGSQTKLDATTCGSSITVKTKSYGDVTRTGGLCLVDDSMIRTSLGLGILWNSPLGPLRIDYAIPLTRKKDGSGTSDIDTVQRLRFGAQTRF